MEINIYCKICGEEIIPEVRNVNANRIEFNVICEDCGECKEDKDRIEELEEEVQKLEKKVRELKDDIDENWS